MIEFASEISGQKIYDIKCFLYRKNRYDSTVG